MNLKKDVLFCVSTVIIIFLFYLHTINYPWKHFDDQIIFNETLMPVPTSFSQLIDYITYFGLNNHFEASNPFYTTISNIRCTPINTLITLIVYTLFQKNSFYYHLLSLTLHIINSIFLFLIINKISLKYSFQKNSYTFPVRLLIVSILTLIWALHPLNTESILFSANWSAIVTSFFCLLITFYYLNHYIEKEINSVNLLVNSAWIFIIFLTALFNSEYSVTIPLILFFYTLIHCFNSNTKKPFFSTIKLVLLKISPLLLAIGIYILYFISSLTKQNLHISTITPGLALERILWLSPQIFFHFLKLIFLPMHLTIDQSSLVKVSNSILEPYSVFCCSLMFGLIFFSIFSALNLKNKTCFFFLILFLPFFISLIPFLHIISPLYNLASERYLYFPSFFLIVGFSHSLFFTATNSSTKKITIMAAVMFLLMISLSCRTYFRTLDWKDSTSLFQSALKESKNDLIKGLRMEMLGGVLFSYYNDVGSKEAGKRFIEEGIYVLENSLQKLELEKIKYQDRLPQILKFYGLDPKTTEAKTAYLLSFTKLGLERNTQNAYNIMKPHMEDLSIIDTQILDLYIGLLFSLNRIEEAEKLLNYALEKKVSPTILLPLAEIYKNKYKDWTKAESLLKESYKYFPYDSGTLLSLKNFYLQTVNPNEYAHYSYLHGLRTHSK